MTNPTSPSNILEALLKSCEEHNGLDHCKNCGLDQEIIEHFKKEVRAETIRECIEVIDPLTRYCRSKFVLHKTDCCNHYEGVEAEPVVDMLLESDVKSSLTTLL